MAEDGRRRSEELEALRLGLDLGLALIDTAEMYGDGDAEELVGEAVRGRRDDVFLVSKALPSNAGAAATVRACEGSLQRLGTDRLDLYLLHWRGSTPLDETLEGFATLVDQGKIRHWGVSNFDADDMAELVGLAGGEAVVTDQVLYNPSRRGIEWDLLPWCQDRGLPIMAYSPIEQGRLLGHPSLAEVAKRHDATPAQVALAWVLGHDGVLTVPKAGTPEHVRENWGALELQLTDEDLRALDAAFPPPAGPQPLEML
jgi:diketogulonate reductase-like aldo/keto reductase